MHVAKKVVCRTCGRASTLVRKHRNFCQSWTIPISKPQQAFDGGFSNSTDAASRSVCQTGKSAFLNHINLGSEIEVILF